MCEGGSDAERNEQADGEPESASEEDVTGADHGGVSWLMGGDHSPPG